MATWQSWNPVSISGGSSSTASSGGNVLISAGSGGGTGGSGGSITITGGISVSSKPRIFSKYFWDLLRIKLQGGVTFYRANYPTFKFTAPSDAYLTSWESGMGWSVSTLTDEAHSWLEEIRRELPVQEAMGEDLYLLLTSLKHPKANDQLDYQEILKLWKYLRVTKKIGETWGLTKVGEKLISQNYLKLVQLADWPFYQNNPNYQKIILAQIPRAEWSVLLPQVTPKLAQYFGTLLQK